MSHVAEIDLEPLVFAPADSGTASADRLDRFDAASTGPFANEQDAREATERGATRLARLALMLEAHGCHGMVVVVQGMDAAGKDEAIHHVMSAVDPGNASARSFARLEGPEAAHAYLRRASHALPPRGRIAVFNRSHYERVIADRVHPENLESQSLPGDVLARAADGSLWSERHRQIRDFERYLRENGIEVVKLFLHVSREEQRRRLLDRIDRPEKRWDFDLVDVNERERWDDYMAAYDDAFRATSVTGAPWYVIPGDHKWFARAATAAILIDRLERLHDEFPEPDAEQRETLEEGRRKLESESRSGAAPDSQTSS